MKKRELFFVILGALAVVLGLLLNEWLLAGLTSDGQIDAGAQLWLIRLFNIGAVAAGLLMIFFRRSPLLHKMAAGLAVTAVFFVLADFLLYLAAPLLGENIVAALSPQAQVRFYRANQAEQPWIYAENDRHARPNEVVELFGREMAADGLGYRNPPGYLEAQEEIDVLLLGDSFVWGTEERTIADYMRAGEDPPAVYNLGMAGSGVPQWGGNLTRFQAAYPRLSPQVIIFNFYSGNDITDTQVFRRLLARDGRVDSAAYYTFLNYQFLLPDESGGRAFPKLPELFFLLNYAAAARGAAGEIPTVEIAGQAAPACLKHREPLLWQLDDPLLDAITSAVLTARRAYPDAAVVFSYIPTSGAIYGEAMADLCPDYAADPERQAAASALLAEHAAQLDITYVDLTPELRAANESEPVWSTLDHFSPAGYKVYAELLLTEIEPLLAE